MVNAFNKKGQVWVIDTSGSSMIVTEDIHVRSIRWIDAGASAGDTVIIQDEDSTVLWESVAAGANYVEESLVNTVWRKGFKVTTLASGGKVYINLTSHAK